MSILNLFLAGLVGNIFVILVYAILIGFAKFMQYTIIGITWFVHNIVREIKLIKPRSIAAYHKITWKLRRYKTWTEIEEKRLKTI